MEMLNGNQHYEDCFYLPAYGAYRWDRQLTSRPGTWFLVSRNLDFDYQRGIMPGSANTTWVVDDFGSLAMVPA